MSARTRERLDLAPLPVYAPPVPQGATWNGLRRLWMVDGVAVAPQPAPPIEISRGDMTDAEMRARGRALAALPPSVKVSA
jgi:hypothetical protein